VISTGKDREDFNNPIKPENWTEIYRFKDGEYKLLSHKDLIEKPKTKPVSPSPKAPASPHKVK